MNLYFIVLIIITGAFSIYTDIHEKKIKNKHLIFVCSAAVIGYLFFLITGGFQFSTSFILNISLTVITAFILYIARLWEAGDSKLFITYSFLLTPSVQNNITTVPCIALFANTFLISFLCLLPLYLKNIGRYRLNLTKRIISLQTAYYLSKIIFTTFGISWAIEPFLQYLPIKNSIFLNFLFIYTGYIFINKGIRRIKYKYIFFSLVLFGSLLRLIVFGQSFSFGNTISYLVRIAGYSLVVYMLNIVTAIEEKKEASLVIAPFMFVAALLTKARFLSWVLKTLQHVR